MVFIFQVRDAREKFNPKDVPEFGEVPEDREPILTQFTSQWDLKLFREAQVMLSNVLQSFSVQCDTIISIN